MIAEASSSALIWATKYLLSYGHGPGKGAAWLLSSFRPDRVESSRSRRKSARARRLRSLLRCHGAENRLLAARPDRPDQGSDRISQGFAGREVQCAGLGVGRAGEPSARGAPSPPRKNIRKRSRY